MTDIQHSIIKMSLEDDDVPDLTALRENYPELDYLFDWIDASREEIERLSIKLQHRYER